MSYDKLYFDEKIIMSYDKLYFDEKSCYQVWMDYPSSVAKTDFANCHPYRDYTPAAKAVSQLLRDARGKIMAVRPEKYKFKAS